MRWVTTASSSRDLVTRETGGNPFFAAEVLRHLAETGAISREDGRWVAKVDFASIGLPESVREVVDQRVRRLGEDAHRILTVASVIGRDFDLGLLARAAERDEDDVLDTLEEAAAAAVVAEVPGRAERFTFTHALFQHTLYDELSASRRSRAHRRVGELLESELGDDPGDHIGELAYHWVSGATPAEAGKAAAYADRAGKRALEALAPEEAIRWFRQAVDLLDRAPSHDPHQRLEAVVGLGDAQRQAGDPAYRETLLAAAAEAARLGDTRRLVAAALANQRGGWASNTGAVDAERIATLEQALGALAVGDSQARALLLATLAAELTFSGDLDRRRALAAEAESMARRLEDDATLLRVLNGTFVPLWVPDDFAANCRGLGGSAHARRPRRRSGRAVRGRPEPSVRDGVQRRPPGHRRGHRAHRVARRRHRPAIPHVARDLRAMLGGPARRRRRGSRPPGNGRAADRVREWSARCIHGVRREPAQHPVAPRTNGGDAPSHRAGRRRQPRGPCFPGRVRETLCECGRTGEAGPLLAAASSADFHDAAYDYIWLTNTTFWADSAAWLGDKSAAAVLFDRLAPYEPQGILSGATFTGTVGMYLARLAAVLGRLDEADDLFERTDARSARTRGTVLPGSQSGRVGATPRHARR